MIKRFGRGITSVVPTLQTVVPVGGGGGGNSGKGG